MLLHFPDERSPHGQTTDRGARQASRTHSQAYERGPRGVGDPERTVRRNCGRLRAGAQGVRGVGPAAAVAESAETRGIGGHEHSHPAAAGSSWTRERERRAAVRACPCPYSCAGPVGDADAARCRFWRLVIASVRLRALGTGAVLCVTDPAVLPLARRELVRELRKVDLLASRFRKDSELTALNRRAGETVHVSRRLFDAVALAIDVARRTGGLVDPTVGRALRLAGYDRTFTAIRVRDGSFLAVSHRSPGWENVQLNAERLAIRVPAGVELDLGATAKAAVADAAVATLHRITGGGVLVSLGGDIAVAGPAPVGGWPIRISDHSEAPLGSAGPIVAVAGGGLATSGVAARCWPVRGGTRHHIIDPRTGSSAVTPWRTVTVTGVTCVDANAASTAAVILGTDALAWLGLRGFSARLLRHDGSAVFVGDWPRGEAQAA